MVIRAILRHVQNALVLSSALLVVLALQRLQHYEFRSDFLVFEEQQHHRGHQDDEVHESLDDFRLGMNMNHQMRFEAPFLHVGLFQFAFPKLPTLERIISNDQTALRQDWEIAEIHTLIHYLVDISGHESDCQLLDAAAVFAHSLKGPKNVIHAIVNDTMLLHCNASSWLSNVGYNVIPSGSITLLPGCSGLWQAYALKNLTHVDVLVLVPATTVSKDDVIQSAVTKNNKLVSNPSMGNTRIRRRALSASTYSSRHTIQLLRPKLAAASHTNDCQATSPMTVCKSSPSHCRIVRETSLIIPSRKCALPWTCPNITAIDQSSCRNYHDLWREQRRDMMNGNDADFCANGKYHSIHEQMMNTESEPSTLD